MEKVDEEPFDVASIMILISHYHQMAISKAFRVGVLLLVLQSHEILDVLYFGILRDLIDRSVSHVEQLSTKGKHTKKIWSGHRSSGHCKAFCGISFGEDQRTLITFLSASFVCVDQFGIANSAPPVAVTLLENLIGLLLEKRHDIGDHVRALYRLHELIANSTSATKLTGLRSQLLFGLRGKCRIDDLTVNEEEDVVSNLVDFESWAAFGPLLEMISQLVAYLVADIVHMGTTRGCSDRIYEGNLLKGHVRDCETDLPASMGCIKNDI